MDNCFEGYFLKHQNGEKTLSVIVGRAQDCAFVQAITDECSYRVRYPIEAYHIEDNHKEKCILLSGSQFSKEGISLSIHGGDWELTGQVHYSNLCPINGDIMGPFRFLPMQCRHKIVSMKHTLCGKVLLNGKEFDFTGGKGYIEGDSGRSFPKSYTWVQCNAFDRDCSIMASAAHITFACSWFWGCICVVWLDGAEYRLATYRGAKIKRRDQKQLIIEQGDLLLKIDFLQTHTGHLLDAPQMGKMQRSIHEVPCAPVHFEFCKGRQTLFEGESRLASYENVE